MAFSLLLLTVLVLAAIIAVVIRSSLKGGGAIDQPSCGNCGYPTRGISELKCPECGADLRVVGILQPGEGRAALAGCVMPLLATILIFLLAVGGFTFMSRVMPTYEDQSTHFDLSPGSGAYAEVLFSTEMTVVIPASESHLAHNFDIQSNFTPPYTTTVDFGGGPNTKVQLDSVKLEVMSMPMRQSPNTITYAPAFRVDPKSRLATWTDAQGTTQTSNGPVTDKDLLTYFNAYNIDTSKPEVVAEAQQLTAMIDGLIAGQKQFTLQGFQDGGYGSGSSGHLGPPWFIAIYFLAWVVIWIIVMVVIVRRARKRQTSAMD